VTAVLSLSLAGASASTLTVKILHPRTDPYETPSNRFVTFAAAAFDSEEQDVSAKAVFTWDFGDGARAEGNPTKHLYEPGEYRVTVTATLEDAYGEASMTVIVGEPAPLPKATLRVGGALIRRMPSQMPAGMACDQPEIQCVEQLPADDALYCNFYYRPPGGEQFSGHSGGPALNFQTDGYKLFGMADWHSCVMQNYQAGDCGWAAELYVWWEEDPIWVGPEGWGIHNTIVKAEDDCGAPYTGVLAYDPQGDAPTISWTLSHLAYHTALDPDPLFNRLWREELVRDPMACLSALRVEPNPRTNTPVQLHRMVDRGGGPVDMVGDRPSPVRQQQRTGRGLRVRQLLCSVRIRPHGSGPG